MCILSPNIAIKWLALVLGIREVQDSNPNMKADFSENAVFWDVALCGFIMNRIIILYVVA
jgi:hypothetical protein